MLEMTARTYAIFSRGTDLATEHILQASVAERCIRNINKLDSLLVDDMT